jgi:hypothetical protein
MLSLTSDLSLSGYEFRDPTMLPNNPQENKYGDQPEVQGGRVTEPVLKGLIIEDKVIGSGPPIEKTSVASFYYIILKEDKTVLDRNDQGISPVSPVRPIPTQRPRRSDPYSGQCCHERHQGYHAR